MGQLVYGRIVIPLLLSETPFHSQCSILIRDVIGCVLLQERRVKDSAAADFPNRMYTGYDLFRYLFSIDKNKSSDKSH